MDMRGLAALAAFGAMLTGAACADPMLPQQTEVWEPKPPKVEGKPVFTPPPSDAIVLFDGSNLANWTAKDGKPAGWTVRGGVLTVKPGAGDIATKAVFEDVQLHVEWRAPKMPDKTGQGRGNSGVFLQGLYEVQVLDSFQNETYVNGQAASIYKQSPPLANATLPPEQWQSYDIIFRAPRFDAEGKLTAPGRVTVLHNGVLVQNDFELQGETVYIGLPKYKAHGPGPIVLQDHGDPVSYRNIWIRKL